MNAGVALYLRVSTEDQDLAGQERELRAYACTRHWDVTRVYSEKKTATGRVEREAWDELRKRACLPTLREFERVLVWSLDRWSRDASFVRAVGSIEELEVLGIRWHSYKEPQLDSGEDDSPNLARDLLRGILPTIAKFEALRIRERTRVAMREIKEGRRPTRSGRPVGRPPRVTRALLEEISRAREDGAQWRQIARRLHVPATSARKWYSDRQRLRSTLPAETPV